MFKSLSARSSVSTNYPAWTQQSLIQAALQAHGKNTHQQDGQLSFNCQEMRETTKIPEGSPAPPPTPPLRTPTTDSLPVPATLFPLLCSRYFVPTTLFPLLCPASLSYVSTPWRPELFSRQPTTRWTELWWRTLSPVSAAERRPWPLRNRSSPIFESSELFSEKLRQSSSTTLGHEAARALVGLFQGRR